MKLRLLVVASIVPLLVVVSVLATARDRGHEAAATGVGPTISFGAPSLVSGKVQFTVNTSGSGFDPYTAFSIHLRWTPGVFTFSSATNSGGLFASGLCPPPDTTTYDSDGGGVNYACTSLSGATTATGLLATFNLTPVGTGCFAIHLFTVGPPDNGTDANGTYTVNDGTFDTQANTYGADLGVNQAGATCTVPGTPTVTPTPTNTATPTETPTSTPSPSPTNTPIVGVPDVSISGVSIPPIGDGGTLVTYTLTLHNSGTVAANGITASISFPPGEVPIKNGNCKTYIAPAFICKLASIAPNDSVNINVNAQLPITQVAMSATPIPLHIDATNEPVANQSNNDGTVATTVRGCPDINGDGTINILDFAMASTAFGLHSNEPGFIPAADQNSDGQITIADLSIMATRYGQNCSGLDTDHDGLPDSSETNVYHTSPTVPDTDSDGIPDGIEVLTFGSDPLKADTSGDGYTDGQKVAISTDPTNYCAIMRADVNMDGVVNILDFAVLGFTYHLHLGDPGYNGRVDQNKDNSINILDAATMAMSYNHHVTECP